MSAEEAVDHIQQAGEYRDPGRLEVQIAAPAVLVRQHVAVAGGHGDREDGIGILNSG